MARFGGRQTQLPSRSADRGLPKTETAIRGHRLGAGQPVPADSRENSATALGQRLETDLLISAWPTIHNRETHQPITGWEG